MSNTSWTPGPWWVMKDNITVCPPKPRGQSIICRAAETYMDRTQREANARLIAAAPEMAEALEQTAAAMDALHPSAAGDMSDAEYARLWNATREQLAALLSRIRGDAT